MFSAVLNHTKPNRHVCVQLIYISSVYCIGRIMKTHFSAVDESFWTELPSPSPTRSYDMVEARWKSHCLFNYCFMEYLVTGSS